MVIGDAVSLQTVAAPSVDLQHEASCADWGDSVLNDNYYLILLMRWCVWDSSVVTLELQKSDTRRGPESKQICAGDQYGEYFNP